jgi:hypothetical protein
MGFLGSTVRRSEAAMIPMDYIELVRGASTPHGIPSFSWDKRQFSLKYARTYDGRGIGFEGEMASPVHDAIFTKFSYADLMSGR